MDIASPSPATSSFPVGWSGCCRTILGCRAVVLLHDEQGHPLLATTHRGDLHLSMGLPSIVARSEQREVQVRRIIVDREGMAIAFLAGLYAAGRTVVTVLRTNQYRGLA